MVLEKDEYVVYDDKITISKKALEECRDHYCNVADKFKPKKKDKILDFRYGYYIGKADVLQDILKMFEELEGL